MVNIIQSIILELRPCFSRKAAFHWFIIIILAFIIRCDHEGVTSFIRWLFINPDSYDPMLRFFRATSWNLETLLGYWVKIAIDRYPLIMFNGRPLLIGDGIKISKEAKKMPGVKSLHQDSENSGKAKYIFGHHFGYVGLLVGGLTKAFCLPLQGQLHEGVETIHPEKGLNGKPATLVTRMANLVVEKAKQTGFLCYVTLDAYFAVGPAFLIFKAALNEKGEQLVHLIARAKSNYVGYSKPCANQKRFQEKDKINLIDIFNSPELFKEVELTIYGEVKTIKYYFLHLLWRPTKDFINFVWIIDGDGHYILMCSDLKLSAPEIITIYSYRFKIEVMFLVLKHLLGGFCYHFWTKAFPKLKRGEKLTLSSFSESEQKKVRRTVEAIERFVNLAGIALGLLQYLSLTQTSLIWGSYYGWLRTCSSGFPSERVVQSVVRAEFFSPLSKVPICRTLQLIFQRRRGSPLYLAM
ncbi:hypothetical protein KKH56_02820 [bacterium]|nr:hypothetical protein [bacterium]